MPDNEIKFISFPVKENTKIPAIPKWQSLTNRIPLKNKYQNKGLITGKRAGFIVFDLDNYKENDKIFNELGDDLIKRLSEYTYTIKSASGGYHFYFIYNELFPRTCHSNEYSYDLLSTGGFIMSPPSKINDSEYKKINNLPINKMPKDIEDFILKTHNIKEFNIVDIKNNDIIYHLTPKQLSHILSKVPKDYLLNYNKWLAISTCIKKFINKDNVVEMLKVWDDWCKSAEKYGYKNYDYKKNINIFKSLKTNKIDISLLFIVSGVKPIGFHKIFSDLEYPGNTKYINKEKLGFEAFDEFKNNSDKNVFLIKSDTGTGKTTSFNHYIKKTNKKFISLVSRQLLGKEQQLNLKKLGIDSKFYLDDDYDYGDNIIICADSLLSLKGFDFSEYIIFIDEFNSVIEYLITSNTFIKEHRTIIAGIIYDMIERCEQLFAVDADISKISYDYIKSIVPFDFIVNEYKHFKGVKYYIYNDAEKFIETLKKENKFLLCSDSATIIENLNVDIDFHKIIGRNKDGNIYDDEQEINKKEKLNYISLDKYDRVGFSPKIIYGQDSIIERPVFCWFKGHTITPPQMVQQIARCRKPTEIHIYYDDKNSKFPIYENIEDVENDINNNVKIYNINYNNYNKLVNFDDNNLVSIYYKSLKNILYKYDCYKTSKYIYLRKILEEREFKFMGFVGSENKILFKKENVEGDYEVNFINSVNETIKKQKPLPKYISNVNKILNIPLEILTDYKELFINDYSLKEHFLITKIFKEDDETLTKIIKKSKDYKFNKMEGVNSKIKYLNKLMNILNLTYDNIYKDDFNDVKKYNHKELEEEYKIYCKTSKKKFDFDNPINLYKAFGNIIRGLMSGCITSERITKNKNKFVCYRFNEEAIEYHKKLISFRTTQKIKIDDIDFI
jgi:hypothetical protein